MGVLEGVKRAASPGGQPTTTRPTRNCVPFILPDGIIRISDDETVTLTANAVFTPQCAPQMPSSDDSGIQSITDMRAPFHASITPQAFATGAATVIAWMLLIMLFITPRTFFVGGVGGRSGLLGRRGMISGATGGGSIIGVGTRPWLQKVAAMTVAISLSLATADTFKIASRQYAAGYMDANQLREEVVGGNEIKISRVISDIFIWLAQVQTLIRLFPRHKEKVLIKWIGFALILFDITFSCLNSFGPYEDAKSAQHFKTAIPALSYLFQLSLSMLYAAWVLYYAITKRRYAFYHPMMWNIAIVALLSLVAILTPVVFFITDISNESVAGWGDYFRWVGAAAASVIVWEWVERIEALEREERKDGILGREVYDGDEMLETTPYTEVNWQRSEQDPYNPDLMKRGPGGGPRGVGFTSGAAVNSNTTGHGFSDLAQRLGRSRFARGIWQQKDTDEIDTLPRPALAHRRSSGQHNTELPYSYNNIRRPPSPVASPISRTNTTSADSTVYTVRYHPVSDSPPAVRHLVPGSEGTRRKNSNAEPHDRKETVPSGDIEKSTDETSPDVDGRARRKWQAVSNPFRRRKASPPPEVQRGRVIEPLEVGDVSANIPAHNYSRWALKSRLGAFAAEQGEKIREKARGREQAEAQFPVTIIPAHPRGRTWSPELLQQKQSQSQQLTGSETAARQSPQSQSPAGERTRTPRTGTQPDAMVNLGQTDNTEQASTSSPSTTSRIRFTTGTFHRTARAPDRESRNRSGPSTVDLGTEQLNRGATPSTSAEIDAHSNMDSGEGSSKSTGNEGPVNGPATR